MCAGGQAVISTHSRAKAAGAGSMSKPNKFQISTHSRAKAAGCSLASAKAAERFQLTAARRRLVVIARLHRLGIVISTHSRAKAAGFLWLTRFALKANFNSQPREGGWASPLRVVISTSHFNSQPREGGWIYRFGRVGQRGAFQLTAARRRLGRHAFCTASSM